jgi:hypothetical protein
VNVTALACAIAHGLITTAVYWLVSFNHGNPLESDLRYFIAAGMIAAFFEPVHWGLPARVVYTFALTLALGYCLCWADMGRPACFPSS